MKNGKQIHFVTNAHINKFYEIAQPERKAAAEKNTTNANFCSGSTLVKLVHNCEICTFHIEICNSTIVQLWPNEKWMFWSKRFLFLPRNAMHIYAIYRTPQKISYLKNGRKKKNNWVSLLRNGIIELKFDVRFCGKNDCDLKCCSSQNRIFRIPKASSDANFKPKTAKMSRICWKYLKFSLSVCVAKWLISVKMYKITSKLYK